MPEVAIHAPRTHHTLINVLLNTSLNIIVLQTPSNHHAKHSHTLTQKLQPNNKPNLQTGPAEQTDGCFVRTPEICGLMRLRPLLGVP